MVSSEMSEDGSMCLRILSDMDRIIKNDLALKNFSVIPELYGGSNCKNKNPVRYEEHCLALEGWCVKHIYFYAYSRLFKCRAQLKKNRMNLNDMQEVNKLLIGCLLIQPNVTTFWNMKRELVEQGVLDPQDEIRFAKIVLSNKCKSQETFTYRKWCIYKLLKMGRVAPMGPNSTISATALFSEECQIADLAANNAKHNYHAWNHRIWAMQNLFEYSRDTISNILMGERSYSLDFTMKHISEHAAFNYRQYILKLVKEFDFEDNSFEYLLKEIQKKLSKHNINSVEDIIGCSVYSNKLPSNTRTRYYNFFIIVLVELLNTLEQYFKYYAIHESVWYHRRFVIYNLLKVYWELHGQNSNNIEQKDDCNVNKNDSTRSEDTGEHFAKLFKSDVTNFNSSYLHEILSDTEKKILQVNCSGNEVEIVEKLAKRHKDWLHNIMHLDLNL